MNINQLDKIYSLDGYGAIKLHGADAEKLLQGQVSCDASAISASDGKLAIHCNPKGRILSLFYLSKIGHDFYLILPNNMLEITLQGFSKYAQFYKVDLTDVSDDLSIYGYSDEATITDETTSSILMPKQRNRKILISLEKLEANGLISFDEWKRLDIIDNIPSIYTNTSGVFLPHDLSLDELNVIDFDKGCFTGQEIIARMHYRASIKKRMLRATTEKEIMPGDAVYDESLNKQIATTVDTCKTLNSNNYTLLLTGDKNTLTTKSLHTKQGQLITLGSTILS